MKRVKTHRDRERETSRQGILLTLWKEVKAGGGELSGMGEGAVSPSGPRGGQPPVWEVGAGWACTSLKGHLSLISSYMENVSSQAPAAQTWARRLSSEDRDPGRLRPVSRTWQGGGERGLCLFWDDGRGGQDRKVGDKTAKSTSVIKGTGMSETENESSMFLRHREVSY